MDHLIAWCGFLGGWLLVAGPLSQAIRELEEEDFERDDLISAAKTIEKPQPVSRWWWLFPPAYYLRRRRRSEEFRKAITRAMPQDRLEALVSFKDKADTWGIVATGAFLIAVKETWELCETYGWPHLVFWLLGAAMVAVSAAITSVRTRRRKSWLSATRDDVD